MKKIIVIITPLLLLLCLTGCGANRDPKYIGKWEATEMKVNGESINNFVGVPISGLFRFEIGDDGNVKWVSGVDNKIIQNANSDTVISWKETEENKITFKTKNLSTGDTSSMDLSYQNGMLVIEDADSAIYIHKVDEFTNIDMDSLNNAADAIQASQAFGGEVLN